MGANRKIDRELWVSKGAQTVAVPDSFPAQADPLEWALGIAAGDAELMATAMRWVLQDGPQDDEMIYLSRGDATEKVRQAAVDGVRKGAAVQLQINAIEKTRAPVSTV